MDLWALIIIILYSIRGAFAFINDFIKFLNKPPKKPKKEKKQ